MKPTFALHLGLACACLLAGCVSHRGRARLDQAAAATIGPAPKDAARWVEYGRAAILQNEPGEAARAFRQALRLQPDYVLAYKHLALVQAACGEAGAAAYNYQQALCLAPQDTELWSGFGYLTMNYLGDPETALVCFRQALECAAAAGADRAAVTSARIGEILALRRADQTDAAQQKYTELLNDEPELAKLVAEKLAGP
jgi:Tfp pilus assembly protein PilF